MSTKVNKKVQIQPRFHLVFLWHKGFRRYFRVGSCFCLSAEFSSVDFIAASPASFLALLRRHNFDLSCAISMPCSVWDGFSTNDLPF